MIGAYITLLAVLSCRIAPIDMRIAHMHYIYRLEAQPFSALYRAPDPYVRVLLEPLAALHAYRETLDGRPVAHTRCTTRTCTCAQNVFTRTRTGGAFAEAPKGFSRF